MGKDLPRGPHIGKGPLTDHHQPVSQSGHILHGMADKDNGGVVGLPVGLNIGQNAGGARRVQTGGGLVQNEDLGLHGDDPRNGHPPLLAAGELKRGAGENFVTQTGKSSSPTHPPVNFAFVQLHVAGSESNVLVHRFLKQLILRILKNQPHLETDGVGQFLAAPDILSLEENLTRGGTDQAVEMLDQGRLSRTRASNDAKGLPLINGQVHGIQGPLLKRGVGAVYMG